MLLIKFLDIVIIKNTNGKTHLYSLSISKLSNKLFDLSPKLFILHQLNFYNKVHNILINYLKLSLKSIDVIPGIYPE